MSERWFLVPVVTDSVGGSAPKYRDTSGITASSGRLITVNGTDRYVVRFYGTTSALDSVESNADATSIQESGLSKSEIATELNNLTGYSYSFNEWEQRFLTS